MSKYFGWASVHRSILDNPKYKDPDVKALWIELILRAQYEDKWVSHNNQRIFVKRGQFLTGRKTLSESTGVQESKIQRILKRWENEQQIEQQTFSKYRLISITNYHSYQNGEQQSDGKVNTTNNTINSNNKTKAPFEPPTVSDVANYFIEKKELPPSVAKSEAEKFLDYYETVDWVVGRNKKPMSNWKTAASGWDKRRKERETKAAQRNGSNDIDFESSGWS